MPFLRFPAALAPHILAITCATLFIWQISMTPYLQSGLQFVAPVLVLLTCHVLWLALAPRPVAPLAPTAFRRAFGSAVLLALATLAFGLLVPRPVSAQGDDVLTVISMVVFCVFIIAIVLAVLAGIGYLVIKGLRALLRLFKSDDAPPDTRLFDMASLALAFVALGALSLEGLPRGFHLPSGGHASASRTITAPPKTIHAALQTATLPEVPLPAVLATFPKPAQVIEHGGTRLGATRDVVFSGREGTGTLSLEVTESDSAHTIYTVTGDSTPFRGWIGFQSITYTLTEQTNAGATLTVSLAYERKLAPALAFGPLMRAASYFAMDVLARDVKTRAEAKGG